MASTQQNQSRPSSPQIRGDVKISILVIEDDPDDIYLMRRAFHQIGLPVSLHFARNGQHALEQTLTLGSQLDIIFLDINMPIMDGATYLKTIRRNQVGCDLPIVVTTSSHEHHIKDDLILKGASSVYTKPETLKELQDILEVSIRTFVKAA